MQRVEVTREMIAQEDALKAAPLVRSYEGVCAGCGRRLPCGGLYLVMGWTSENWASTGQTYTVQVAKVMYCRQCPASEAHMVSAGTGGSRRAKHRASPGEQAALPLQDVELTPQETALRLLAVMDDVPASSKKLARRADLEWSENLRAILKALAKAGKVKLEDGGWRLV